MNWIELHIKNYGLTCIVIKPKCSKNMYYRRTAVTKVQISSVEIDSFLLTSPELNKNNVSASIDDVVCSEYAGIGQWPSKDTSYGMVDLGTIQMQY